MKNNKYTSETEEYAAEYRSPIGTLILKASSLGLTKIIFADRTYAAENIYFRNSKILEAAEMWLEKYFTGKNPSSLPPLDFTGTDFQNKVWNILKDIPYGTLTTYGSIAQKTADLKNIRKMSPQAVGGAVGRNPIPIIIPCHRVIGKNRSLIGYSGGMDIKIALLKYEGFRITQKKENFFAEENVFLT